MQLQMNMSGGKVITVQLIGFQYTEKMADGKVITAHLTGFQCAGGTTNPTKLLCANTRELYNMTMVKLLDNRNINMARKKKQLY